MIEMSDRDQTGSESDEDKVFLSSLRQILLAGIGAVVLAQDELEDFVWRLASRGEIAEVEARDLLDEIDGYRLRLTGNGGAEAAADADGRLNGVLVRMKVPSRREIDELSERIAELGEKVDELAELGKS